MVFRCLLFSDIANHNQIDGKVVGNSISEVRNITLNIADLAGDSNDAGENHDEIVSRPKKTGDEPIHDEDISLRQNIDDHTARPKETGDDRDHDNDVSYRQNIDDPTSRPKKSDADHLHDDANSNKMVLQSEDQVEQAKPSKKWLSHCIGDSKRSHSVPPPRDTEPPITPPQSSSYRRQYCFKYVPKSRKRSLQEYLSSDTRSNRSILSSVSLYHVRNVNKLSKCFPNLTTISTTSTLGDRHKQIGHNKNAWPKTGAVGDFAAWVSNHRLSADVNKSSKQEAATSIDDKFDIHQAWHMSKDIVISTLQWLTDPVNKNKTKVTVAAFWMGQFHMSTEEAWCQTFQAASDGYVSEEIAEITARCFFGEMLTHFTGLLPYSDNQYMSPTLKNIITDPLLTNIVHELFGSRRVDHYEDCFDLSLANRCCDYGSVNDIFSNINFLGNSTLAWITCTLHTQMNLIRQHFEEINTDMKYGGKTQQPIDLIQFIILDGMREMHNQMAYEMSKHLGNIDGMRDVQNQLFDVVRETTAAGLWIHRNMSTPPPNKKKKLSFIHQTNLLNALKDGRDAVPNPVNAIPNDNVNGSENQQVSQDETEHNDRYSVEMPSSVND